MFSFFKKKTACPILDEDKLWIDNNLDWINAVLFPLDSRPTILPSKQYFDRKFTGEEADAEYLLKRIGELMGIDVSPICLEFYQEWMTLDGIPTKQEDPNAGTAGWYHELDGGYIISIETNILKSPKNLIAVIAHELTHYVLLGIHNLSYEDERENEYLTDLVAIAYGFGIFLGNTAFYVHNWGNGLGWSTGKQGYLPQQVVGYVLAAIARQKEEFSPAWVDLLEGDLRKFFLQSMQYMEERGY